ncbi:hypothetical protein Q1695_007553 [Nippostrongylus brasiliensis]|nr:hypothetical protein Q1695_007553 [Nippostrongylus brasiliensis]
MNWSWWWRWLLLAHATVRVLADVCVSRHFHDVRDKEVDDYIIYGLTQDCQIFFIRSSQISLLSTINVNVHNSYCYPNLVQLHVKSHSSLLLLTKQAGNRICTLDVQIPPTEMLFGDHLFSYSLLSSLPYASCSHSSPQMFRLEPDLSFLDTVFNDIVYFIDAQSTGALWTVHQFQITADGYLRHLEKISINNHAKPLRVWTGPDLANEYIVALDNQRNFLYVRNRFENSLLYECSYDLLFRPNTLVTHYLNTSAKEERPWLNSMAADQNILVYTETDRKVTPPVTRLFAMNTGNESHGLCVVYTNYAFDVGVVRTSTLMKMRANPLPTFEDSRRTSNSSRSATTKIRWTPRPPSTHRHKSTTKPLKLTTIYMTSTEKIVTSTEFRLSDDSLESTTEILDDTTLLNEIEEKAKILERDNEGVGLMTTINSEEDADTSPPFNGSNDSSVGQLQNSTLNSADRFACYSLLSSVFCIVLFVLQ